MTVIISLLMFVVYVALILGAYQLTRTNIGVYTNPPRKKVIVTTSITLGLPLIIALAAFTHQEIIVGILSIFLLLVNALILAINISSRLFDFIQRQLEKWGD